MDPTPIYTDELAAAWEHGAQDPETGAVCRLALYGWRGIDATDRAVCRRIGITTRAGARDEVAYMEAQRIVADLAADCAAEALRQGAAPRPLADDEDAFPADYDALEAALGRPATRAEGVRFRRIYSATLAAGGDR